MVYIFYTILQVVGVNQVLEMCFYIKCHRFKIIFSCNRNKKALKSKIALLHSKLSGLLGIGACLAGTGYITCEMRQFAVVLLCVCCVFGGQVFAGFLVNHPEFSGQ